LDYFFAEHSLARDFFVKQLAEKDKNKAKCKVSKKIVYKQKNINILMNLSLTPTIYCGRIKLLKKLPVIIVVFYEELRALAVKVRALNHV
jgi:hypothetical protein